MLQIGNIYYCCNNYFFILFICFCLDTWAWHHRLSRLNCLISQLSIWDWDDCLLCMLYTFVIIEWKSRSCVSLVSENSKQKTTNTCNSFWMVEKPDIMLKILHKWNLLGPPIDPRSVASHWFGSEWFFFSNTCNYYYNNWLDQ